jgi:hypothetical protein
MFISVTPVRDLAATLKRSRSFVGQIESGERRSRCCPRVLRQPVSKWSRKIDQASHTGKVTIKLVRV